MQVNCRKDGGLLQEVSGNLPKFWHCVLLNAASFTILKKGMTMRAGIRPTTELFVELVVSYPIY